MKPTTLCSLALLSLGVSISSGASAQTGTMGAFGSAHVDGTFTPGEWDAAAHYDFNANLLDGTTTPATMFVMNDNTNLYLAVRVRQSQLIYSGVAWTFDTTGSGVWGGDGQDALALNSFWGLFDDFYFGWMIWNDTDKGGSADGQGAVLNDGSYSYYEVSHPLNSGDPYDFALGAGATVSFLQEVRLGCLPNSQPCADTDVTGRIAIYPIAPPDTTAPKLTLVASKTQLWPANHKLVPVTVDVSASDDSGFVRTELVSLTSSEADGGLDSEDVKADIQDATLGTLDTAFSLRAERANGRAPRIYTATYRATDNAGNTTTASVAFVVPANQK